MLGPIVMEINHLKTHQSPLDPFACHEARKIHASRGRRKRDWERGREGKRERKENARPDKVKSGVGEGNTQLLELITGAKFVHTLFYPYKRWYFLFLRSSLYSLLVSAVGAPLCPSCASYCVLLLASRWSAYGRQNWIERERETRR